LEHHYLPPKVIVIEKISTQTDELNGLIISMTPENNYEYTPPTDYYLYDQTPSLPEQPQQYFQGSETYAPKSALENSEAPIFRNDDEHLILNKGVTLYKFENGKLKKAE